MLHIFKKSLKQFFPFSVLQFHYMKVFQLLTGTITLNNLCPSKTFLRYHSFMLNS
jgi:hypothetical protein